MTNQSLNLSCANLWKCHGIVTYARVSCIEYFTMYAYAWTKKKDRILAEPVPDTVAGALS